MQFSGSTIASRPGACTNCHMHLIETEPSRFHNSLRIVTLCHWNHTFWCRITIKIDYSGQCITRFIAIGFFIAITTLNFTTTQLTRFKRRTSSIYMVLSKLHIIILHITMIWLNTAVCHHIFCNWTCVQCVRMRFVSFVVYCSGCVLSGHGGAFRGKHVSGWTITANEEENMSRSPLAWLSMMTSSNGNIFRVTGPLCGEITGPVEFPAQMPVTRSFDVFFDLRLNKRLSKQPWGWWFETPAWSLWRHRNAIDIINIRSKESYIFYCCVLIRTFYSWLQTWAKHFLFTCLKWV